MYQVHEIGHVYGLGTLWGPETNGLTGPTASNCPYKSDSAASREWRALSGCTTSIPTETDFSQGTKCVHWDEACLVDEMMTGFASKQGMPLSRMTVGALEDLGYTVDYGAADSFPASRLNASCRCNNILDGDGGKAIGGTTEENNESVSTDDWTSDDTVGGNFSRTQNEHNPVLVPWPVKPESKPSKNVENTPDDNQFRQPVALPKEDSSDSPVSQKESAPESKPFRRPVTLPREDSSDSPIPYKKESARPFQYRRPGTHTKKPTIDATPPQQPVIPFQYRPPVSIPQDPSGLDTSKQESAKPFQYTLIPNDTSRFVVPKQESVIPFQYRPPVSNSQLSQKEDLPPAPSPHTEIKTPTTNSQSMDKQSTGTNKPNTGGWVEYQGRTRQRRELSQDGRNEAMYFGKKLLRRMQRKRRKLPPSLRDSMVGDQFVSVLYMEDGQVFSVEVFAEEITAANVFTRDHDEDDEE